MNAENSLKTTVAVLESKIDLMEAEMLHLHELLTRCGFVNGIYTLRDTIEEFLKEAEKDSPEKPLSQSE